MFELKVVTHFAAAHKLQMVAEKCENLHGHNWKVEACVKGEKLNQAGVLKDFGEIKDSIREIMKYLDHCYLNELKEFSNNSSSSENIAVFIAEELEKKLDDPAVRVSRINVWESENSCASYIVD